MSQEASTEFKAVIPAAGLGTRFLPLTRAVPKELLPAGRKALIHHVVEEAVRSGLREICVVIREGKEAVRDYFTAPRRSTDARGPGAAALAELEDLLAGCELVFVRQARPQGLGDALAAAREFVGRSPFVMMVPDQLFVSDVPAARQLTQRWRPGAAVWTSLVRLPKSEVEFFGGARGFEVGVADERGVLEVGRVLTDEETRELYRDKGFELRGFGRTVYPPEIFEYLGADYANPQTGEVDLLKTFEQFPGRLAHRGVVLAGEPLDLGTFERYERYLPRLWGAGA